MKILITDTLFVFEEHEARLKQAGFEIVRNPNPKLSEDELIEALRDVDGYIVGGIEHPSDRVISSTSKLKCVAVTAADWQSFMPGWKTALDKGIAIGNTPGANTFAVAEYSLAQMLSLIRELPSLTNTGNKTFSTTRSLEDLSVGVIGAGRIGETMIKMLSGIGVKTIYYWNRTRRFELESRWGVEYLSLSDLCSQSDVITNHTSSMAGEIIDAAKVNSMKNGTILIANGGHGAVNYKALKPRLEKSEIVFAEDEATEILTGLPHSVYYHSNSSTAFNTQSSLGLMSDIVVDFVIDVLKNNDRSRSLV